MGLNNVTVVSPVLPFTRASSGSGEKSNMEISLVIPAYNEARSVAAAIEAAAAALGRLTGRFEVIIVDDGSLDGTGTTVQALARDHPYLHVVTHPQRQGKGAAVQTGMLKAQGEYRFFMDADLSYSPEQIGLLWSPLRNGFQVAVGRRWDLRPYRRYGRRIAAQVFRTWVRVAAGLPLADPQCGFKGFCAEAAQTLFSPLCTTGFAFDVELLLRARGLGLRITEVAVTWQDRADSTVRLWRDGPRMAWEVLKLRHHKTGR